MRNFENVSTSGLGAIPIPARTVQESNESYAALMFKRQPVLAFRLKGVNASVSKPTPCLLNSNIGIRL